MKISREQKQKNHERILRCAVALAKKAKGFQQVSMRALAKEAGLSEAAIYNYFPTKEDVVFGYWSFTVEKAIETVQGRGDFQASQFHAQIHALMETHLSLLRDDRHFVEETFQQLFVQPMALAHTAVAATRRRYSQFVGEIMDQARMRGEFQAPAFQGLLQDLLWDFHIGVIYYWLRDKSKDELKTTQLIDLSLGVIDEILKGQLFTKVSAVAQFLFKEHLLSKLTALHQEES